MFLLFANLFMNNSFAHEINQKYTWETYPKIMICPDSTIKKNEVENAISYWTEELGVKVKYSGIYFPKSCSLNKENTIYITESFIIEESKNGIERTLAKTLVSSYHYSDDPSINYVDYAVIRLSPEKAHNTKVFLHEFGHALGLKHSNHPIMDAYYF